MSESLEDKQQFLRIEVLEQGYDPQDFSQFMMTIKNEENINLEQWSMAEIKNAVESYKAKILEMQQSQQQTEEKQEPIQQNENNLKEEENKEQIQSETQENNLPPINNQQQENNLPHTNNQQQESNQKHKIPVGVFDDYEKIIKCVKLEENEITNRKDLFITISEPEKVKLGIFSSAYYQYSVKTAPVNYNVKRKVDDFTFLYSKLPLLNPGVFNPVLPHFEFGLKDDSPKKMLYIQNYMNSLIENIFHRSLPIVFEFLTLPQDQWNKKREKYNSLKEAPSVEKMVNLEGQIHIIINKQEDAKALKIKEEINKKTENYDKFNAAMDELLANMEKFSNSMKSVSTAFSELTNSHKDNEILSNVYKRLSSLTKIWSSDIVKQKEFLRDEFKYFFKFYGKENVSFLKIYDEFNLSRNEYKNKYEKYKKSEKKTKKDLDEVLSLRQYYGYSLYNVNNEYKLLGERQSERALNKFVKYNENKDIILQNSNNCIKLLNFHDDDNNMETTNDNVDVKSNNVCKNEGIEGNFENDSTAMKN